MSQRFGLKSGIYNPPNSKEDQHRTVSEEAPCQDEELAAIQACAPFTDLTRNHANLEPSSIDLKQKNFSLNENQSKKLKLKTRYKKKCSRKISKESPICS